MQLLDFSDLALQEVPELRQQSTSDLLGVPGGLSSVPELMDAPGLQQLLLSGEYTPGPTYKLAPQAPAQAVPSGGYGGDLQAGPGNLSAETVGKAMLGMMMSPTPMGVVGTIAGLIGQSIANDKMSAYQPSMLDTILGVKGPLGVDFSEIDSIGSEGLGMEGFGDPGSMSSTDADAMAGGGMLS